MTLLHLNQANLYSTWVSKTIQNQYCIPFYVFGYFLSVTLLIILFEHKSGIDITDKSMLPFTVDMVFMWDNKYGPNKRGRVIW